jgi:hypothetical protein
MFFGIPNETALYWAGEIRLYALGVAVVLAAFSFLANWAHSRLQSEVSAAKDRAYAEFKTASEESAAKLQGEAKFLQESNQQLTERLAWRALPQSGEARMTQEIPTIRIFVTTLGDMEAKAFGQEVIAALRKAGADIVHLEMGSMSPPVYGTVYFEQNWTPEASALLERARVPARSQAGGPMGPLSFLMRIGPMPAILVGQRSPP